MRNTRLRSFLDQLAAPDMVCRNGRIADYNIFLAGCTKANAVPYDMGAGEASKGASMYEIKYMGKDCVELGAAASVLVDAARSVREFPSVAEDSGEDGHSKALCPARHQPLPHGAGGAAGGRRRLGHRIVRELWEAAAPLGVGYGSEKWREEGASRSRSLPRRRTRRLMMATTSQRGDGL